MDLTSLTNEELQAHQDAVNAEQDRRWRLANTPEQVAGLARDYADGGGDPTVLVDTINQAIQEVDRR